MVSLAAMVPAVRRVGGLAATSKRSRAEVVRKGALAVLLGLSLGRTNPGQALTDGAVPARTRVELDVPVLSDEQLLDHTEARAARYMWEQAFTTNGFVRDTTNSAQASIGATGFGLAALVVIAERYGSSPEWTVTPGQAKARAQQILDAMVQIQALQQSDSALYGKAGALYHFVDQNGKRFESSEVSTADMALLVAGALTAGQYFGGTVRQRSNEVAENVDWSYFFDPGTSRFYHAWRPELTPEFGVVPPDEDGYLSFQLWDRPTDEILLISLLALASDLGNEGFAKSLYGFPRVTRTYAGNDVVNSYFGSLFTYIFAHIFFDFEALGPDDPVSLGVPVQPVDWFQNAKSGALANRQFAIDQASTYATYGPNQWGLSASYRPDGSYFGENGAKPAEANSGEPIHDGTIPPYGAISSMPLVRTSPTENLADNLAFQALRNYHDNHFEGLWGPYGPLDSFRTTLIDEQPVTEYAQLNVGIDVGPEVLMIENYRTGLVWRQFMRHPSILVAVKRQFPGAVLAGVGGVAELSDVAATPSRAEPSSAPGAFVAALVAALSILGFGCGVWFARRRRSQRATIRG